MESFCIQVFDMHAVEAAPAMCHIENKAWCIWSECGKLGGLLRVSHPDKAVLESLCASYLARHGRRCHSQATKAWDDA